MKTKSELYTATTEALVAEALARVAIAEASAVVELMPPDDAATAVARRSLDYAVLQNHKGKWAIGRAVGTYRGVAPITASLGGVRSGRDSCNRAAAAAWRVVKGGKGVSDAEWGSLSLNSKGTEIFYCDDIPVVPAINPVVVLRGSSFEMGRQYAEQIIDIFGLFIFQQQAARSCYPNFRKAVGPWERELAHHTPELVDFSRGWAEGATGRGVTMDYLDVVAIWTGDHAPSAAAVGFRVPDGCDVRGVPPSDARDAYLDFDPVAAVQQHAPPPGPCSGAAAWGSATAGGGAVAACSTDHDCTFQATIVAFPDDGYPFVYTPFAANGFIPGMGEHFMAGHPGMNSAGLAYVHHGGGWGMTEPVETWGYGIRRGAETFHSLRYAASTKEALRFDLTLPIGDAGYPVGCPGGFYLDRTSAIVIEGRTGAPDAPRPILREVSRDETGGSYDFLYATNNAVSPEAGSGFAAPEGGYRFGQVEGWYTTVDDERLRTNTPETGARAWTAHSWKRNRYLFERIRQRYGSIKLDDMIELYRHGGPCRYDTGTAGERLGFSTAHRGAAFTCALELERRKYLGCVGPAVRGTVPMDYFPPFVYYDETYQFWELTLADTPEEMASEALHEARRALDEVSDIFGVQRRKWIDAARREFQSGQAILAATAGDIADVSRAVRRLTHAQVRARQARADPD